ILFDYYESENSIKRRKFVHRYNLYKKKLYWRKKFSLPIYYDIYAYKELAAGLVPKLFFLIRRKKKCNVTN
ncbi:MAG: hypothetical protein LIR50_21695, partial [Bacillota bacterium]|nr:hypothetical protein [Bacillota bacterium]